MSRCHCGLADDDAAGGAGGGRASGKASLQQNRQRALWHLVWRTRGAISGNIVLYIYVIFLELSNLVSQAAKARARRGCTALWA